MAVKQHARDATRDRAHDQAVTLPDGQDVTFNFDRVTAKEMSRFFKAARENDVEAVAALMARVVVDCPWGDPADAETFANLPYYTTFSDVLEAMVAAGNGARKAT